MGRAAMACALLCACGGNAPEPNATPRRVNATTDPLRYRALCEAWNTRIEALTNRHSPHALDDQRIRGLQAHYAVDPWGNAYRIESSKTDASVRSAGPDRVLDTDDDVVAGEGLLELLDPRPDMMTRTEWRDRLRTK